jgi:Holliday junction DNA helicase RuvA
VIGYLRGKVIDRDEQSVILEVGGVGYEVMLPAIEMKALRARLHREAEGNGARPRPPESSTPEPEIALYIHYHVAERQPVPLLIGFNERQARAFYRLLLTVAEVGPALAAKAMTIAVCDFASAIERKDVRALSALPGIGRRKADQIIATLHGKVIEFALMPAPEVEEALPLEAPDFAADAVAVLVSVGHRPVEAERMIEAALKRNPEIADTQALLQEIWTGEQAPS